LFIFDGHGSHVTLEAIEQAQAFGLDMVTWPSHTSHALQPLNVACFKLFKIALKKESDTTMINRNYIDPENVVLVGWVDKALDQALSRKNIILGFKSTRIWPLDPKAMDERIRPILLLYIVVN
jgi:hypothetical protein